MTLTDHLHACVREFNHFPGSIGARRDLRAAIQRDPVLRDEAEALFATLPPVEAATGVTAKCFIARTHRAALEEALTDG